MASRVEAIPEMRVQRNVVASAGILARLLFNQVLRRQQSVIYQEWREEGEQEGAIKEVKSLILRQLTRRIGDMAPDLQAQVRALSLAHLVVPESCRREALGEALLDFSEPVDLVNWLQGN